MATDAALISGEFDEAGFLRYALHLPSAESEKARLVRCIESVQGEISNLVNNCNAALLDHLESLHTSENALQGIRSLADTLQSSTSRLRHTISEPYELVQTRVSQLRNCMTCVDILRQAHRFLGFASKLREVHETDILRAARTVRDIEEVLAQQDLTGIDVVDQQMNFISSCSTAIRSKALEMLRRALASQNQVDCGAAMQCFYSLDILPRVIHSTIAEHKREALRAIVKGLEVTTIVQQLSQDQRASEAGRMKELVFAALETTLSTLVTHCNALATLWRVYNHRKDPTTQQTFVVSAPIEGNNPLEEFWLTISSQLKEKIQKLTKRSNFHAMMVAEFPRISRVVSSFCESIVDFLRETKRGVTTTDSELAQMTATLLSTTWVEEVLQDLLQHFSAQSVDRQREKYQLCIARISSLAPSIATENAPSDVEADVNRHGALPQQVIGIDPKPFLKYVSQEIVVSRQDPAILAIILQNAHHSLLQLYNKMSDAISRFLPVAVSISTSRMTGGEIYITSIANAAGCVSSDVEGWIALLPGHEDNDNVNTCKQLRNVALQFKDLCSKVISPFFVSAGKVLGKQMAGICESTDINEARRAFETALQHFVSRYALLFDRATGVDTFSQQLAGSLLQLCAVAACVVRPTTDVTRSNVLRLVSDVEESLALLCPIERVGKQQRTLRALRHLLALDLEQFKQSFETWPPRLHPLLLLLFVLKQLEPPQLSSLHTSLKMKATQFVEHVVSLMGSEKPQFASILDAAARNLAEYEARANKSLDDASAVTKRALVKELSARLIGLLKHRSEE